MKKTILTILFLSLFIPVLVYAQNVPAPDLQVDIDTVQLSDAQRSTQGENSNIRLTIPWINEYVVGIYRYGIGIVGVVAAFVLMYAGVVWLTAAGNQSRVSQAKTLIVGSLSGLVIALSSYMILYYINPNLVSWEPLEVDVPDEITIGATKSESCSWQKLIETADCPEGKNEALNEAWCGSNKPETEIGLGGTPNIVGKCCCVGVSSSTDWEFDSGIENQWPGITPQLSAFLQCMREKLPADVGRISSLTQSQTKKQANWEECITPTWTDAKCAHSKNSCHYGGYQPSGQSPGTYAVDFGDENNASFYISANDACKQELNINTVLLYNVKDHYDHLHIHIDGDCPKQ